MEAPNDAEDASEFASVTTASSTQSAATSGIAERLLADPLFGQLQCPGEGFPDGTESFLHRGARAQACSQSALQP